jgi:uncharacterized membrane-anchored protein
MRNFRMAFLSAVAAASLAALQGILASPAVAQGATLSEQARQDEEQAAWRAGGQAGTRGPADVTLIDQAVLKLPDDYFFIPKAEGARLLRALGNTVGEQTFVGLIVGAKPGNEWIVATRYIKDGYIKDDDAKNWDANELLQSLKDGTEEANKDRAVRGFAELEVLGWVEKPTYDATTHRLVWSLLSKHKNAPDSAVKGVNYNTYALGRDGYFSLNLLTNSDSVGADKGAAHTLLAALAYNPDKRYEDFDASTDHIAAYGLAALVAGVAAKKAGLFVIIFAFAAKFAKVIALGALAVGGGIWKLFRRRPESQSADMS